MLVEEVSFQKSLCFSSFWTFTFSLTLFWTHVNGQYHLIGSQEPIRAAPGDDVTLPCHIYPGWNATGGTVEWSRPDQKADSGRQRGVDYVFVYRFLREDRDMMMDSYIQRTSLSTDRLQRGDVSLTIRKVTLQDTGRFRCFIPNLRKSAEVQLVVDPDYVRPSTESPDFNRKLTVNPHNGSDGIALHTRRHIFIVPVFIVFLVLLSVLIASSFDLFHQKLEPLKNDPESDTPSAA